MYRIVRTLARGCADQPAMSRYGVKLTCRPNDLTFHYAMLGQYGQVGDELVTRLKPGMCFIDVGANQGVFSLMAAKIVGAEGRVISFEPSRREFAVLLRNIDCNRADNILPIHCGLADRTGLASLRLAGDEHTGLNHYVDGLGQPSLQLDLRQCHSLVKELIGSRSTVIKIDVEGYEAKVIRSLEEVLRSAGTVSVPIEIDGRNLTRQESCIDEIYDYMDSIGYTHVHRPGYMPHYDEVFYRAD